MFLQKVFQEIKLNGVVVGQLADGEYTGKGVSCYLSGGRYEGDFVAGQRHGYGQYHFANNNLYEGYWENDYAQGQGKLYTVEGEQYDGKWVKGRKHGFFLYKDKDGNSFLVKFEYNQMISKEVL